MPSLTHSPAQIVARLLATLGLGAYPDGTNAQTWPVYAAGEPDAPDSVITVYDTDGRGHGRSQIDGERQQHHGIQVRVRAGTHALGWPKAQAVAEALDTAVYDAPVTVGGRNYLVHAITRTTDVLALGKGEAGTRRSVFTVNALVSLTVL